MKTEIFNINIKITPIVTSLLIVFFSLYLVSCDSKGENTFNAENSDPEAIEIADQVMEAMGGEKNWEDTRHISWTFFDSRKHFWDKNTGDIRIESLKDDVKILMNINSLEGEVYKDGAIMDDPDSISTYLEKGKNWWINDSYWLVMPYKLKDPGVRLKYIGEETVNGNEADVIQLTFEEVGATPENKYLVYVDKENKLVTQWAFFRKADQDTPDFVMPWEDYNKHGGILLSGKRGDATLSNISVHSSLPKEVYNSFEPVTN